MVLELNDIYLQTHLTNEMKIHFLTFYIPFKVKLYEYFMFSEVVPKYNIL